MPNYPRLKYGWLGGKRELYISSPFGYRIHPIKHIKRMHYGVDIAVPVGTEILAPMKGTLKAMGVSNTAGLWCVLNSGSLQLVFMHLTECLAGQKAGATKSVSEGQTIGKTGGAKGNRLSGSSTGPHLHFEYRWSESGNWTPSHALNPVNYLSERLTGKANNEFSRGVQPVIKRRTGEEIPPPEVGDGKKMEYVSISEADAQADLSRNVSELTDGTATEDIDDYISEDTEIVEGAANGIWQIIKLAMDSSVQELMLYDASISAQTGSILNFFNKACQQPLVEFNGDTYGDQYYFTVRRPPFDKKYMLRALNSQHLVDVDVSKIHKEIKIWKEDAGYYEMPSMEFGKDWAEWNRQLDEWRRKFGFGTEYWNKVAALESEIRNAEEYNYQLRTSSPYIILNRDIISSNIQFNNQGIYSWYQFYPQYELAGDKMQYIVPAVLFPEYAEIWGSRALQVTSQYASFRGLATRDKTVNEESDEVSDNRCRSVLDDLKYLIESNAYNPFTRQGTLTIVGTRRIRRGMFIKVCIERDVDEYFYVENVSQNYSINNNSVSRTTTLTLSHGMVAKYVKESKKENGEISYFDLIDFGDYEKNRDQLSIGNWRETISHWAVNKDVFNFFLRKQQFINSQGSY